MTDFDDSVKALGPRPQPVKGGASYHADREWFLRYLGLMPKNGDDLMKRFRSKAAKEPAP
jgi:hypothetical protein